MTGPHNWKMPKPRGRALLFGRNGLAFELSVVALVLCATGMWLEAFGLPRFLWAMWVGGAIGYVAGAVRSSVRLSRDSSRISVGSYGPLNAAEPLVAERVMGQLLGRARHVRTRIFQDGQLVIDTGIGRDGLVVKGSIGGPLALGPVSLGGSDSPGP